MSETEQKPATTKRPRKQKLTLKQKRFIQAIPTAKNQTDAALKAGYAKSGAATIASNLMNNNNIVSKLNGVAPLAIDVLSSELANDDAKIRISAADKILKYTPTVNTEATYSFEDILE